MSKVLFVFGVLLLFLAGECAAARPTAYARAKARGRVYVHRPNYRLYCGVKRHRPARWFKLPALTRKAGHARSRF